MSSWSTRSVCCAIAVTLTANVPCMAQQPPVPPPTNNGQAAPAPVNPGPWPGPPNPGPWQAPANPGPWQAPANPGPLPLTENPGAWPANAQQPDAPHETSPYPERIWELLSETPPQNLFRNQAAGFGFDQSAIFAPSYRVTWIPDAPVSGQGTNLTSVTENFHVVCPVFRDECQMFGLTFGVRNTIIDTDAVIPNTGQAFPSQLWDIRFGFVYKYTFSNGWTAGADVNFGSASDRPFASVNELTAGVSTFLRIPVGEHNAWLFSLSYSPTGELNFPIPGVAFYWQPNDWFNATIGVPTKIVYRPIEDVILEAAWMPLTTVTARASWRVWGGVFLYTAYNLGNESYYLYNSPDDRDRFFYYDQRVTAGVKMCFGPHFIVDLSSGYAFDRYYFEGQDYNDRQNRIDIGNSPFLSFMVEWRF